MAHGDALIFLTNIVWIFILFLFIYFFFVVFFLPTFYKKFRIRVFVRGLVKIFSVLFIRNFLVSLTFFVDFFRGLRIQLAGFFVSMLGFFSAHLIDIESVLGVHVEIGEYAQYPDFVGRKPIFCLTVKEYPRVMFLRTKVRHSLDWMFEGGRIPYEIFWVNDKD